MKTIEELQKIANQIRKNIIEQVYQAQSGHPGGALSCADVITALYFSEMKVDPQNPAWEDRDRFVLSKGHASPALYAALAEKGFLEREELKTFRKLDSRLQGHPDKKHIPGVDMTTGSLGQGLSTACGMALAAKLQNKDYRVYCTVGDGEIEEGQIWEAAMTAAKYKLDNLCVIVDNNNLQIDGRVEDVMNVQPIDEKFESFGFCAMKVDGHDIKEILSGFEVARKIKEKPTVMIAETIKGKGVSFMENQAGWHGKAPKEEEYKKAMEELAKEVV